MFRRTRDARREASATYWRTIKNLNEQVTLMHAQAAAASVEFDRRYAEMKRDRDYWREQAEGGKL